MSEFITRQEAKRMISGAIAAYDRTSRERHEKLMQHLREIYGNGSGHEGFLERSFKDIKDWVDGQRRKEETAEILESAKIAAQASRDKKLSRLLTYAKIGALLMTALLGKDWAVHLFHTAMRHVGS